MSLSSLIVQRDVATMRQVEEALARQVIYGGDLVTNLLEIARVDESVLTPLLAESMQIGAAPPGELPLAPEFVRGLIPVEFAVQSMAIALDIEQQRIVLVVAEPLAPEARSRLSAALGMEVEQLAAPAVRVWQALARSYGIQLDRRIQRLLTRLSGGPTSLPPSIAPSPIPAPVSPASRPPSTRPSAPPTVGAVGSLSSLGVLGSVSATGSLAAMGSLGAVGSLGSVAPVGAVGGAPGAGGSVGAVAQPVRIGAVRLKPQRHPTLKTFPQRRISSFPAAASAAATSVSLSPSEFVGPAASPGPERHLGMLQRNVSPSMRPNRRRRGPLTLEMARREAEEAVDRNALLDLYFDFSRQFFDYAALFLVQGDIAEGRDAFGGGAARERVLGIGVPLDLPSILATAREKRAPIVTRAAADGLDAVLLSDLFRPAEVELAAVPLVVRTRAVALLVGDCAESGVDRDAIQQVLACARLVGKGFERIIVRRKLEGFVAGNRATDRRSSGPPAGGSDPPAPEPDAEAAPWPSSEAASFAAASFPVASESAPPPPATTPEGSARTLPTDSPWTSREDSSRTSPTDSPWTSREDSPAVSPSISAAVSSALPLSSTDTPFPGTPFSPSSASSPSLAATTASAAAAASAATSAAATTASPAPAPSLPAASEAGAPTFPVDSLVAASLSPGRTPPGPPATSPGASSPSGGRQPVAAGASSVRSADPARAATAAAIAVARPSTTLRGPFGTPTADPPPAANITNVRPIARQSIPREDAEPSLETRPQHSRSLPREEPTTSRTTDPYPRRPEPSKPPSVATDTFSASFDWHAATGWNADPAGPQRDPPARHAEPPAGWHTDPEPWSSRDGGWRPATNPEVDPSSAPRSVPSGVSVPPHQPAAARAAPERSLPTVIIDLEGELGPVVDRIVRGDADEAAEAELLHHGERAMPAVMQRFPGPVTFERARIATMSHPPRASECGPVLRLVARERKVALPFVLDRLNSTDPETRGWATYLLAELPYVEAIPQLIDRLRDDDPSIGVAAARAIASISRSSPDKVSEALKNLARSNEVRSRVAAARAMGEVRDGWVVPELIADLRDAAADVARAAHDALVLVTRQDFGQDPRPWLKWWDQNGRRHRIEWLIDSLTHEVSEVRRASGEELRVLSRQYFGYASELPARDRERAQQRYRDWWITEGRARQRHS